MHIVVDYMKTWTMRYKGAPLHLPKMMKPRMVEMKERIQSQKNYEDLLQLITNLQASHAWVFRTMDVIVCTHAIPYIGTLTDTKIKAQVRLELDSYFDELMRITTRADLVISENTMHQYVSSSTALKTMMHMLLDELDRGARVVYLDAMEVGVGFQKYVTKGYTNTIVDYQAWHQFTTVNPHEDVKELVFP